jgi:hypothetical protein
MGMSNETPIIETVTEAMEVLPIHASTADVAFRAGERKAAEYTSRGYPTRCIGVVKTAEESLTMAWTNTETQIKDYHYDTICHIGYRPVLTAEKQ